MHLGPLHVRKRFLGSLLAVSLVGGGNASAIADNLPEIGPSIPFAAPVPEARPVVPVRGEVERLKRAVEDHRAALRAEERTWTGPDGTKVTVEQLERFLQAKNSPLTPYAADFVRAGKAYDVDPRVVVAIGGIESSFGRRQLGHNAWGWSGGPGGSLSRWPDWPTAIDAYTERLGALYDTTNVDEPFAQRYVPPNWRHWLAAVRQFMGEMDAA